ncbi:MAG: hypothetical protein ACO1OD_08455 [Croceibacterium sp.]
MRSKLLKSVVVGAVAVSAIALSAPALAQASCDRATLLDIADRYIKAQAKGSLFELPVGEWVDYRENLQMSSSATGVLSKPMEFAWSLPLLDTVQCQVFVEGVVTEPDEHVLASVVYNGFFGVNQVSTVIGTGSATEALGRGRSEAWDELPEAARAPRAQLLAAANAHLDGLAEEIVDRRFVVDETKGAVGVFARIGNEKGPAASYTLRFENGAVRYVHASSSVK